jgi:hypothetical protein
MVPGLDVPLWRPLQDMWYVPLVVSNWAHPQFWTFLFLRQGLTIQPRLTSTLDLSASASQSAGIIDV